MEPAIAECASAIRFGAEAPVTALWTTAPAWPATSRSATAGGRVSVASASARTPNSRVLPVRRVPPAQECVLNTSES